jgi:GT2 family glycosyltransferase
VAGETSLAVVIVSYNCRDLLASCLLSLYRYAPNVIPLGDVWVVDNASVDGTPAMVRRDFPDVRLHVNSANLGFSAANNIALRQINAPYVLVLNPDTVIQDGVLDRLLEILEARPDIGIINCALVRPDGTLDHAAKVSFPTLTGALGHFSRIGRGDRAPKVLAQYRAPDVREPGPVDAVSGAFMLTRRAALDDVGLFDEGYWLYIEDYDLCYRFGQRGWVVWHQSDLAVTHVKGGTAGRHRRWRQNRAFHAGMVRFYRKHYAPDRPAVVNGAVYAAIGVKLMVSAARSSVARFRNDARSKISAPARV